MGEIDRLFREQRDQALRLRAENERLRSSNDGWSKAVDEMEAELRKWRKMAEDLAVVLQRHDPIYGRHPDVITVLARFEELSGG